LQSAFRLSFIAVWLACGLACGGGDTDPLGRGLLIDSDPPAPPDQGPSCPVELTELSAYQSVKIPLGRNGAAVQRRNAELIAGKPALFRVFVRPTTGDAAEARVRLTITTDGASTPYEAQATVNAPSRDEAFTSTLDFPIPADQLRADARVAVELVEPACVNVARTRLPQTGEIALHPQATGTLRVRLVPLRYDADGSGRLPDTSPAAVAAYQQALLAMYPVASVELTVREPVPTSIVVGPQEGWTAALDLVRQTRQRDHTPGEVYDFGLVVPAPSHAAYCGTGCTTGVSFVPAADKAQNRASIGLGFPGPLAIEVLAHELGHAHGRAHAPCGGPRDPDAGFPYPEALIGAWGYDARAISPLLSPTSTRDIMGYCGPRWVSDYTYQALTTRSAQINGPSVDPVAAAVAAPAVEAQVYALTEATPSGRMLFVSGSGVARWGDPAPQPAEGTAVSALLRQADNQVRSTEEVRALEVADTDERLYWVPDSAGATALELPGRAPVAFPTSSPAPASCASCTP
jgi:hypothetical protein